MTKKLIRNKPKPNGDNISIIGDFKELSRVRDFILSLASSFGFDEENAFKISLAVDEACSNIIRHAYTNDKRRRITIAVETKGKQITVRIFDNGLPFNPLETPLQDMNKYMKDYQQGGLGIHIMRSVMDNIAYFPSDSYNPYNLLLLKKSIK